MKVQEALKSIVGYPLSGPTLELMLERRGLNGELDADRSILSGREFELSTADAYIFLVTSASIQEGDYSLSVTEKQSLLQLASSLYRKWGEADQSNVTPVVRNLSSIW